MELTLGGLRQKEELGGGEDPAASTESEDDAGSLGPRRSEDRRRGSW